VRARHVGRARVRTPLVIKRLAAFDLSAAGPTHGGWGRRFDVRLGQSDWAALARAVRDGLCDVGLAPQLAHGLANGSRRATSARTRLLSVQRRSEGKACSAASVASCRSVDAPTRELAVYYTVGD